VSSTKFKLDQVNLPLDSVSCLKQAAENLSCGWPPEKSTQYKVKIG
jgi:hypothetical protein